MTILSPTTGRRRQRTSAPDAVQLEQLDPSRPGAPGSRRRLPLALLLRHTMTRRSSTGLIIRLIAVALGAAISVGLSAGPASASASDPSGSGAVATTIIGCDSQAHTLYVYTSATQTTTVQVERQIQARVAGGTRWYPLYLDGSQSTQGWTPPMMGQWRVYNMSAMAGVRLYFWAGYRFTVKFTTPAVVNYAGEYPTIQYWNPATGQWLYGSYCLL